MGVFHIVDDAAAGNLQPDGDHQVLKDLPVFAAEDGLAVGSDHLHAIAREDAAVVAGHGGVEAGLTAERRQHRINGKFPFAFALEDFLNGFGSDGLDISCVGKLWVGHDRRRIAVDQDNAISLFLQGPAGLNAGIVKFAPLADDDRAGANNQDRMNIIASWHVE